VIGPLLDAATRRVRNADACVMTDSTLSLSRAPHGVEAVHRDSLVSHLRVEDEGRRGVACGDDRDVGALVEAALAGAKSGPAGELLRPLPAPLPEVLSAHPGAGSLDARDLNAIAESLKSRIARADRVVHTWAERSSGRVDVANTRGVRAGYDTSVVGVGLSIATPAETGQLVLRLHQASVKTPDDAVVSSLAAEAEEWLAPPLLDEAPPEEPRPVWLAPRALAVFLAPLRHALLAHGVWSQHGVLAGRVGDRIVSDRITLADDSLAPGRPGSRPIDDEGVVTQRRGLIERGVLKGALADLESALRFGIPATGHARRGGGSRTWIGWSNVVMEPGGASAAELLQAAEGGVLVRGLNRAVGNPGHAKVSWSTPWAYKVEEGQIVGRYPRFVLRGAAIEMLNRVAAVGSERRWIGAHLLPDIVLG